MQGWRRRRGLQKVRQETGVRPRGFWGRGAVTTEMDKSVILFLFIKARCWAKLLDCSGSFVFLVPTRLVHLSHPLSGRDRLDWLSPGELRPENTKHICQTEGCLKYTGDLLSDLYSNYKTYYLMLFYLMLLFKAC